mgnify:CR=1 FL=1
MPNRDETPGIAVVTMFGKRKKCGVTRYGTPKEEYLKSEMLWVERGEDEYGIPNMKPPFCVLRREDWMSGEEVTR